MNDTYKYLLEDALYALKDSNLLSVLCSLKGAATCLQLTAETDELQQMTDTYEMLLSYYIKGADDPSRTKIYDGLMRRAYELYNALLRKGTLAANSSHYATTYTMLQRLYGQEPSLSSVVSAEKIDYRSLFDWILTSPQLSQPEEEWLASFLSVKNNALELQCLALSALTLSGLLFFDIAKFHLLFNAAHSDECLLRVRALMGMAFMIYTHQDSLDFYPELYARLNLWMDEKGVDTELEELQTQLFLTLDTKKLDRKLNEELMPKIMDKIKDVGKELPDNIQDMEDGFLDPELNPEWSKRGGEELSRMFKEFNELQEKGADLYMGSFKNLKQRFPFFNYAANWFYPFSFKHPDIPKDSRSNPFLMLSLKASSLCDSDLYSLCLMSQMTSTPDLAALREKMPEGVLDEFNSMLNGPDMPGRTADFKQALRSYVQGFYRFCNLFTFRKDYPNPFTDNLFLGEAEPFDYVFLGSSIVTRLADFVFKDESYNLALHLYNYIPKDQRNALILQKMGFCCEKNKDFDLAADYYSEALEREPGEKWSKRRLAECLKREGRTAEAELHLLDLEQADPDNVHVALLLADCFIEEKLYEEAFKRLFKADYLKPHNVRAKRAIAWCSLVTGKYDQAAKYYDQLAESSEGLTSSDWLNLGHTRWLTGKAEQAVEAYCRSLKEDDDPYDIFFSDRLMLLNAGKSEEDLRMMLDAVASHKLLGDK